MKTLGIFFGTDTGRTRLVAKQIAKQLGALGIAAAAPVNIGRASLEDFLAHDALILGSPTLGDGELPGRSTGLTADSWEEFLPRLAGVDLSAKRVALYGLGDQEKYPAEFCDAMGLIHDRLLACGARIVGAWPAEGYAFTASLAIENGTFVGLALDQHNQAALSEERIARWLAQVLAEMELTVSA